jgi:hypothetical protein
MNYLIRLIPSVAALIAALSLAWFTLTITGTIPNHHVAIWHDGGVTLDSGRVGFRVINH